VLVYKLASSLILCYIPNDISAIIMIENLHDFITKGKTNSSVIIKGQNGEKITLPFPKEKFIYHLKKVDVSKEQELTLSQLTKLMINVIADFKNGGVSLDELSVIFNYLLWDCKLTDQSSEIGIILDNGAELAYYLRHAADNGEPNSTFTEFLYSLMHFYDRRADIQDNVERTEKERA
jgi:hypothetical protein